MFIRIFRSSSSLQVLLFLVVAGLLWWDAFIHPVINPCNQPVFHFYLFLQQLTGSVPLVAVLTAFTLLLAEAFLLNHIMITHDLAPRNTFLTGFLYFVFMSHSPSLLTLHPVLITNFLVVLIMAVLFRLYDRQDDSYKYVFTSGFLASIASLIYPPACVFLVLIWICLLIYRLIAWREWFIVLLGFITPWLFYAFWFFWNDRIPAVTEEYRQYIGAIHPIVFQRSFLVVSFWSLTGFLLFLSFIKLSGSLNTKVISIRKKYTILIWVMLIPSFSMIYSGEMLIYHLALFVPGIAGLLTYYLAGLRKTLVSELLFIVLLALIVLIKFYS